MRSALSFLLMIILLLLPCTVPAETASPSPENTYTHPLLNYSLTPSQGWLLLDETIVNRHLQDLADGNSPFSSEELQAYYAQLNGTMITAAYSPDGALNLVIGPEQYGFDADIQTLAPALIETVKATLPMQGSEFEAEGSIVSFGETDYLRFSMTYPMNGLSFRACQYIACSDGIGYYLTFTATDHTESLSMEEIKAAALPFLESFRMPEASPYAYYQSTPYTHPDEGYSLSVPENWLAIDRQNTASLISQSPEHLLFQQISAQIEACNPLFVISNNGAYNINILTEPVKPDTTLNSLIPMPLLSIHQDYAAYEDVSYPDSGSLVRFGETDFFRRSVLLRSNDAQMHLNQYFACRDGALYTITLTAQTASYTPEFMDAIARPFLESFAFPE